jgi:ABC-type multidrug transport system fused ATPase/permease subunit
LISGEDVRYPEVIFSDDKPFRDGEVVFSNVSMRYSAELPLALRNISITIPSGSKVAIVGRTGSGKSSLFRVLLRLCSYDGLVMIGGVNIADLSVKELRARVAIVPQDPLLFHGTFRENLDPLTRFSDEEVANAVTRAHLMDVFPQSYFVPVNGDRSVSLTHFLARETGGGRGLSQGQRQLLALVRALLQLRAGVRRLLLIDEASAALDNASERCLVDAVANAIASPDAVTVLTICHRPAGLRTLCTQVCFHRWLLPSCIAD